MIDVAYEAPAWVRRLQWSALGVGIVALAISIVYGFFWNHEQFFRSWLLAYLYWLSASLGCLGVLMLQHLSGGIWGSTLRRLLEAGTATFPVMLLLTVPVVLGFDELYAWAGAGGTEHFSWLQYVEPYLNINFVLIRLAGYFVLWMGLAFLLNRWSRRLDATADPAMSSRMARVSGPGAVLCVASVIFMSTDLVMSLEPEWSSTVFSFIFSAGAMLEGMALSVMMLALLTARQPFSDFITELYFGDFGKIILAIVVFWSYLGFSQLLIIWSGNLPHEVSWYVHRSVGGWWWVGMFLLIFQFFLPLLLLLSRAFKRSSRALACVCGLILFSQLVDIYWYVEPSFHTHAFFLHWMDVVAPIGIGGVWMATFCWWLRRRPMLPLHLVPRRHPRSTEAIEARMGIESAEQGS